MHLPSDIGWVLKGLRANPLVTLTAVISVAMGIAGTSSIFSIADALLMRSAPGVVDARRLVEIGRLEPDGDFDRLSYPDYVALRANASSLESIAAFERTVFGVGGAGRAVRVDGARVSANYFRILGVPLSPGRGFDENEEQRAVSAPVAVISGRLRQRLFVDEREIVGEPIRLNGQPFTIVGVAAAGFGGATMALEDIWIPLAGRSDALMQRDSTPLQAIGRLRPDVTRPAVESQVQQIARDLDQARGAPAGERRFAVGPFARVPVSERPAVTIFVSVLLAIVGLLLLITCTNVAGMLFARGAAREREMAVRTALGATRARVARLLVIESLLIGTAGALTGLGATFMLIRALRNLVPVLPIPVTLDFGVDWRVTGFALVISICAAFMFGLPPAIQAARVDLASATRSDRVAGEAPKRLRLRQAFVIAQIAFSVLLVVCASLLVRSARTAASTNPGFDVANVDLIEVDLGLAGYDDRSGADLAQKILSEVAQLPGVVSAATTWIVPLQLRATATTVSVPRSGADTLTVTTLWNAVSPGYFETLGLPLVRGRSFSDADRPESQNVAVINETLARRAWPGEDALGKILSDGSEPPMEVIGIARDSKYRTIGEPSQPILYRPLSQRHQNQLSLLVRKDGGSLLPDLQLLLRRIDANLPILRASTLEEAAGFSLFPGRLAMWTAAGSAGIGVFLAILGLYGITAYDVTRRTREIGIRLAVGARPSQVMRMVVHRAMRVASMGTLLGLLGAVGLSRILRAILFGVDPLDPLSFASGAAVCILVALAASLVPARRAAGADAVAALRVD